MTCEKCLDWGFIEQEHGLLRIFCDCEKGIALAKEITGDDSDTKRDNQFTGSGDTGKPKQPRKYKTTRKA